MRYCTVCNILLKKQKTFCSFGCMKVGYTGRHHSEAALSKMRGRKLLPATVAKQNASKVRERIRIEGDFTCQKCEKLFASNTSLRAHMSYCSTASGDLCAVSCDICGSVFKSKRSVLIHKSLAHAEAEKAASRKEKMIKAKMSCTFRRSSHAEMSFFAEIKRIKPDAIQNFMIDGSSHVYDMYIPSINTIIEFDGDFWHGNKKLFKLSNRMKKQYRLDESHSTIARAAGFTLVRVWHSRSSDYIAKLARSETC